MKAEPTYPQYAVFAGKYFTAYLSATLRCKVSTVPQLGYAGHCAIRWETNTFMGHLDNAPKLVQDPGYPDYVETICTEAEFRAAYEAAKAAIEAQGAKWLDPNHARYATRAQTEEIVRLLNHPFVGRLLRTKTLLQVNRMDEVGASLKIAELAAYIQRRETQPFTVTGEAYTV